MPYNYEFDNLADMTVASHLVIRGRIVDFKPGQLAPFSDRWGMYESTIATIAVSEVLKGTPVSRVPGFIEVADLGSPGYTSADAPANEAIFFLMNYAQLREEYEAGSVHPDNEGYYYGRPNEYQCILPLVDGKVQIIAPSTPEDLSYADLFPSELDGRSVDEVAEEIQEVATGD